ncbi:MAG: dinitrogenase iron-molybdenum cofactor biosynthesis protein [Bacteroidia bacterium]|jgi:predicted Fe-Mo cluster-binding NifX family protein|nr:dinitrogenase iron-molybdenum cofactor biosynthesis protein [Bacteroidia bacterium]
MKIAITSEGNTLNAQIDSRFGRCNYFAFYDTDTKQTEFMLNPGKEASGGAGPAAVQFVAQQGAKKIIAGEFGGKTVPLFQSLGIQMVNASGKSIAEIIEQL